MTDTEESQELKGLFDELKLRQEKMDEMREQMHEALKDAEDSTGIKKSLLRKAFRIWFKDNKAEFSQEVQKVLDLYDKVQKS